MGDYWEATAEMYQGLFSKPKMTEKLLTRPPFRYIHDIFTSTMEATGFGVGLYGEDELNAKAIKDKDGKLNFLEKLIALVQMAAGEEIPIRASKIVAGQEVEATNIFLQYLYKVATSEQDSGPIVAQILGGDEQEEAPQEDEDDGAEEETRRQAEQEEIKKQKRAAKKKAMEEDKLRQQEEEEEARRQAEQEEEERENRERQMAEEKRKKAQKKKKREEPPAHSQNPNIIEDVDEEEDPQAFIQQEDDDDQEGINMDDVDPESKFGRQAMAQLRAQEEEDEANKDNNDTGGGGIKMSSIRGRRGKKKVGGVERSEPVSYTHLTLPTICSG